MAFKAEIPINRARRNVNEPDFGWASEQDFIGWCDQAVQNIAFMCQNYLSKMSLVSENGVFELPTRLIKVSRVMVDDKPVMNVSKQNIDFNNLKTSSINWTVENTASARTLLVFYGPSGNKIEDINEINIEFYSQHPEITGFDDIINYTTLYEEPITEYIMAQYNRKEQNLQEWQIATQNWQQNLMQLRSVERKKTNPQGGVAINKLRRN